MKRYLVHIPTKSTYAVEIDAESARHAKAIVAKSIAETHGIYDPDTKAHLEPYEYEVQWDSMFAFDPEGDEMAGGSGHHSDDTAELVLIVQSLRHDRDQLRRGWEHLNEAVRRASSVFDRLCEVIIESSDLAELQDLARKLKTQKEGE